jgi:GINS complex subunit 2
MAVPWLPEELSLLAEEETFVDISPHFASEPMTFLSGTYGPFRAGMAIRVPLWLALLLNGNHMCTVHPPPWLTLSEVRKLVNEEKQNAGLTPVPRSYMEVSMAFFTRSPSSIQNLDRVRTAVEDLWQIRVEKIRRSLLQINTTADFSQLPNGTRMEVHYFREPMTRIHELLTSIPATQDTGY